jgi:NAD(P)-dependent dehydrogenase (short-subunit alcohol dehydrogenase family)
MDLGLKSKTAVVTGGSKGIGKAVAHSLAAEGVRTLICARDPEALAKTASEIRRDTGTDVLTYAVDLSELQNVKRAVAEAISTLGRVDILVNNAGAVKGGDFLTLPDDDWISGWNLKLLGYIRMAREVLPHMQQQRSGRIINIAGVAARNPAPTFMAGGAANAALINFTKSLADLAAKSNVLVTAVSPGLVRTDRFESLLRQRAAAEGKDFETLVREQMAEYPLGRIATPEDIASLVTFLASERASFMAGVTITVDGGVSRGVYM